MKRATYLALLLPLAAMASVNHAYLRSSIVRRSPFDMQSGAGRVTNTTFTPHSPAVPMTIVGSIDTIGGTQFDYQANGPAAQTIVNDPGNGIQASWMYSQGNPGVDRNMRWNYYDLGLIPPGWVFNQGADFMLWGINWFTHRSGFGNLDVNAASHCAYIGAHYTGPSALAPTVARDVTPGGGSPEECPGSPTADGYVWPTIGVTQSGTVHAAIMDDASGTHLFYGQISPWCTWSSPIDIHSPGPDAGFPDYNLAASKQSNSVAVIWACMDASAPTVPLTGYYRISRDDGLTWSDTIRIGPPQVFTPGSETLPSFDVSSLYGFFDSQDSLHIVGQVVPFFTGVGLTILPAVVCHYSTATGWTVIHRSQTDTLAGSVGSNTSYAARPSIAEGAPGRLVCVWEQFDSLNLEPNTSELRADILAAVSNDGGITWGPADRIATGGTSSLRYPCIATRIAGDTCHISYLQDLEAGDGEGGAGSMTNNPVIHQRFAVSDLNHGAVAESPGSRPADASLSEASPSIFHDVTTVGYEIPVATHVRLDIFDATGRLIRTLVNDQVGAGSHRTSWDGRKQDATAAAPGIYFGTLTTGGSKLTKKVTLLR
jgi:hypothetical protein